MIQGLADGFDMNDVLILPKFFTYQNGGLNS